jgi:hypothetical protein
MAFKFILDPTPKKFHCPSCNKKRFVRYIDSITKQYCNGEFGRCDREIECGYHKIPEGTNQTPLTYIPIPKPLPFYISKASFQKSLSHYSENNLYLFLLRLFNEDTVMKLISDYKIGTSKKWLGATIFWQINSKGIVGQGKIMLLDPKTGKRIKDHYPHISSVHKQLGKEDQKPEYCFFGGHLLKQYKNKPIAIVESEKTAMIMAGIFNQYLWIATGGLSQINVVRMKPFKPFKIVFYPDLGAFNSWLKNAEELNKEGYQIHVSNLLERNATTMDKQQGFDIADYYIKNRIDISTDSDALVIMKQKNPSLQRMVELFNLKEMIKTAIE